MTHTDFFIGCLFKTRTGTWRCTDVGTRTIIAIKLDRSEDWYHGPPYAVAEIVFNEYDFDGCSRMEELEQ